MRDGFSELLRSQLRAMIATRGHNAVAAGVPIDPGRLSRFVARDKSKRRNLVTDETLDRLVDYAGLTITVGPVRLPPEA